MVIAWARQRTVSARSLRYSPGKAQAVLCPGASGDDLDRKLALDGIGGMQRGDLGHGEVLTGGARLRRGDGGIGEGFAQAREQLADDRGREVGESVHDGAGPFAVAKGVEVVVRYDDVNRYL